MAKIEEIGRGGRTPGRPAGVIGVALMAVAVFIAAGFAYTGVDRVEPGEAAVVVNNPLRRQTVVTNTGYIVHLPFHMTEVYKFNTEDQIVRMSGAYGKAATIGADAVRVKTRDGSNVDLDAEVKFRVDRTEPSLLALAESFGGDSQLQDVTDLVRAFARSSVRELLGESFIAEITDASLRQAKAIKIQTQMNAQLVKLGLRVDSISILNLKLNDDYAALIKDRMDAEQTLRNQASAILAAHQEQQQAIAAATREKNTALEAEKGKQNQRIIEAQGKATQLKARADGEAARVRIEGDQAYQVALADAQALEAEGLTKAEGIQKLAEAYERGGMALVREALAEKYLGRTINGRPYNLSDVVERFAVEPGPTAPAAKAAAATVAPSAAPSAALSPGPLSPSTPAAAPIRTPEPPATRAPAPPPPQALGPPAARPPNPTPRAGPARFGGPAPQPARGGRPQ